MSLLLTMHRIKKEFALLNEIQESILDDMTGGLMEPYGLYIQTVPEAIDAASNKSLGPLPNSWLQIGEFFVVCFVFLKNLSHFADEHRY